MTLRVGIIVGLLFLITSSIIQNTVNLAYSESTQGSQDLVPAKLGIRFQLKINQTAFIESENIRVTFFNVSEDSRCPADAVCIQEGQVTLQVNIIKSEQDLGNFDLTIRAGDEALAAKNFDGYFVHLADVQPYPRGSEPTKPSDYVVTLLVSEHEPSDVKLGEQFQLEIGQTAFIKSRDVRVKMLNVTEDSRCPADAVCIWEGQVTVLLNVMHNEEDLGNFDLTIRGGDKNLAIKTFDGYSIQLMKVDPYPFASQPTELTDYVATLQVSEIETEKNVSIAIKTTKKITLLAIKNVGDAAVYSVKIKADNGDLNFVKARGWDGEQIDANTVMIKTDDRPVMKERLMVVLLLLDDRHAGLEWTAFDANTGMISSGTLIP